MTQKEAVSFCENEQEVPAHLIEVDSQEENQAIHCEDKRRAARGYKKVRYWMGIREWAGGWFRESDGKGITFSNWDILGKFACAYIWRFPQGTLWRDKDCDKSGGGRSMALSALCELSAPSTTTAASSTTTTATTTTSGECAGVVQEGDDCPTSWTKLSTGCYR